MRLQEAATMQPKTLQTCPQEAATMQPTPLQTCPQEAATMQPTSLQTCPQEAATMQPTPLQTCPQEAATMQPTPLQMCPQEAATMQPTPLQTSPQEAATVQPTPLQMRLQEAATVQPTPLQTCPQKAANMQPTPTLSSLDRELPDILREFREDNLDSYSHIVVIARRKHILKSACVALSRGYFEWHKTPNVQFVGEMAEDYGGPRREFFRLLMIELQSNYGIFEGKPGQLLFSYDQKALAENTFFTAGRLMAWSIIHNGPGIKCLNKELFMVMCGKVADLSTFDLTNFLDSDLAEKLAKVVRCSTAEELTELKNSLGDWIYECGVPNIYTATINDLPTIYGQLVTHYIYHR
ncbi:G2/M phase-specific E3 ubiquitin-protein ligase [Anabarilius grahami]|uniref:G2/M phase-specific E3 ubiquitin-protein ligase n=1 Tax=Anabarilius grahami TaxID=495550 RepID=A0A3N0XSC0_ANAGA|nr:G2/M phase-specific E3 ubiquitin-protein ligase [Anabarilius grahami]